MREFNFEEALGCDKSSVYVANERNIEESGEMLKISFGTVSFVLHETEVL